MKITVWGCRGSICVPGASTRRYGGNTTCVDVRRSTGEIIIIDAGSGIRNLGKKIIKDNTTRNLLLTLTHAHWDHLIGFPFFSPAYDPEYHITLCGGPDQKHTVEEYLRHQMEPPYFPVEMSAMKAQFHDGCHCSSASCNGSMEGILKHHECTSIALNHPNGGFGFKFTDDGKTFAFLSDNEIRFAHERGLPREKYVEFCQGVDLLFQDAQYTEEEYQTTRGWGHSTYEDATQLAIDAGVKSMGLFHHDPDRTDDQLDRQVELCRDRIARSGCHINCFAAAEGDVIEL